MDVKINQKSKSQKEIKVALPLEKVKEYGDKAIKAMSLGVNIKGFRPGKAPKQMIEEKLGKEKIWQETCYLAVRETCSQIVEDNDFLIISPPQVEIESMEMEKPVSYKVILNLMPEIDLPDYKKIAKETIKEKEEVEVEQKEIDKTLEAIQKSRAKVKAVNRSAQKGDELSVDFQGSIDGLDQPGLKAEKTMVIIGEQRFIKGFEEQLIGLKEGDLKEFSLEMDLPSKETEKNDKKKIDFRIKVHSVREREVPNLDDEFAKSLGQFSNLKDLQEKIKENIKTEKELQEKERIRIKIIESIAQKTSVDAPQVMVNKELDSMVQDLKARLSQSGLPFDSYLKSIGKESEESLRQEWKSASEKRVIAGLILEEIAKKEKVEVKEEEIEQRTNEYLSHVQLQKEGLPNPEKLKLYFKDAIKNEKVFQLLEQQ